MTYMGNHTMAVQRGINMGVALFIVSEALFFLAIFWAFFHSALSPTVELGAQWPPMGIMAINPFNKGEGSTVLLILSVMPVTRNCADGSGLNPFLISGFSDAESTFIISIRKKLDLKLK